MSETFLNSFGKLKNYWHIEPKQLIVFGVVMSVNFPLFYFLWRLVDDTHRYESFWLRLIATLLCVSLIFHRKMPERLRKYLPVYWYAVVVYCLPFFFAFMALTNHGSTMWLMNCVSALFFTILLVDLLPFLVITASGISLAFLAFFYFPSSIVVVTHPVMPYEIVVTLIASAIIGALFSRNKFVIERDKLKSVEAVSANIAHELRTPLATLQSAIRGLSRYYPALLRGYKLAKQANLTSETIKEPHLKILEDLFEDTLIEIRYANMVINTLLKNSMQYSVGSITDESCHILNCVEEALQRYPFSSERQRSLVSWQRDKDFKFRGEKLLFIHVIFNLLKNALYFIEKAGKGEIIIWIESDRRTHALKIKDTSTGIKPENMDQLFSRFFTTEKNGSGLGLSFCKAVMEAFGGSIHCESKWGSFTQFTLFFPITVE